jgi:hypothetical protein
MIRSGETVAWLTPHVSVVRTNVRVEHYWMQLDASCSFRFEADVEPISVLARSPEHLLEICDVVLRLLAVSVVHSVILTEGDHASINAPALSYLMEQCQSLNELSLYGLEMDENLCRVLGDYSRPGLEIELDGCNLTSAGTSALVECLGRNQGPTKLEGCNNDAFVLADGLRGNSRLKSYRQDFFKDSEYFHDCNQQILAIAVAIRENKGLLEFAIICYGGIAMNEETWGAVCDSLKTHPTLEELNLQQVSSNTTERPPPSKIMSRMQALLDLMQENTSIQSLTVDSQCSRHEIYRKSVIPCLERNRFRPRLLAIQKTRPIAYRAKLLGQALLAARTDANRFWMLLSGNAEVAFRREPLRL